MVDFYRFTHLASLSRCRHAVSMKNSLKPYAFSLALHTGEKSDIIVKNRKYFASLLAWKEPMYFTLAQQTHGDNIQVIDQEENQGWESQNDAIKDCDALITDKQGVILSILTADCVPILLYDNINNVVAAVHAGWKGTKANIISKTVKKMIEIYDSDPKDIVVGIAPAIGACCYEVDEDVAKHFFDFSKATVKRGKKYMLNLPEVNKCQLLEVGVQISNIEMSDICTACEVDKFFSYRKEKGCTGRFVSMIGLV